MQIEIKNPRTIIDYPPNIEMKTIIKRTFSIISPFCILFFFACNDYHRVHYRHLLHSPLFLCFTEPFALASKRYVSSSVFYMNSA